MIAIDLTCIGKDEILKQNIVSGIGTWLSEILDEIIVLNKQTDYVLIINFYANKFLNERFPGFMMIPVGGWISGLIMKMTGKSTETFLKDHGVNTRIVNRYNNIHAIWFPFAIPEIVYSTDKKTIMTVHDFMKCSTVEEKASYEKMMAEANQLVTVSEYIRKELLKKFPGLSRSNVSVIPNSVHIKNSELQICPGINKPFILDINRYEYHKNAMTLLKAFNIYCKCMEGKEILVYVGFGNQEYLKELRDYASNEGIANKVFFFQNLEEGKKNWLLRNASLFVSPSVNEGLGRTPIEAMLCGVPVLTTRETSLYEATLGLAEYCDDPFDEKEWAYKINKILSQKKDTVKLKKIRDEVEQIYSVDLIYCKYEKLFQEI